MDEGAEPAGGLKPAALSVSVVTFAPDQTVLQATLDSLVAAVRHARDSGRLGVVELVLIDNGPDSNALEVVRAAGEGLYQQGEVVRVKLRAGHGNIGYGAGHNLAIRDSTADYHLVLNPDVLVRPDALTQAVEFMASHPNVSALSPRFEDETGEQQFLCKRYPSVLVLFLRGFAPYWTRRAFQRFLDRYEMRDVTRDRPAIGVPIISGAFMFFRRSLLQQLGGFDERYFLYFEDFDLSLRAGKRQPLAYVPEVRVVHLGGHAANKGATHVWMFLRSATDFFSQWRWQLL
jgi:GT2 family glycosyltransferase